MNASTVQNRAWCSKVLLTEQECKDIAGDSMFGGLWPNLAACQDSCQPRWVALCCQNRGPSGQCVSQDTASWTDVDHKWREKGYPLSCEEKFKQFLVDEFQGPFGSEQVDLCSQWCRAPSGYCCAKETKQCEPTYEKKGLCTEGTIGKKDGNLGHENMVVCKAFCNPPPPPTVGGDPWYPVHVNFGAGVDIRCYNRAYCVDSRGCCLAGWLQGGGKIFVCSLWGSPPFRQCEAPALGCRPQGTAAEGYATREECQAAIRDGGGQAGQGGGPGIGGQVGNIGGIIRQEEWWCVANGRTNVGNSGYTRTACTRAPAAAPEKCSELRCAPPIFPDNALYCMGCPMRRPPQSLTYEQCNRPAPRGCCKEGVLCTGTFPYNQPIAGRGVAPMAQEEDPVATLDRQEGEEGGGEGEWGAVQRVLEFFRGLLGE